MESGKSITSSHGQALNRDKIFFRKTRAAILNVDKCFSYTDKDIQEVDMEFH